MDEICGWIDEVEDGWVHGRLGDDGFFSIPILGVPDDQRVELEPGRYISFVNGYMLIDKTIWTTHDMEQADIEAEKLWRGIHGHHATDAA